MMKGVKLKSEASIQIVLIIIKIKSICSDSSNDYNTVIQIYYFVITFTESETKKIMSVLIGMGEMERYILNIQIIYST